MKSHALNAEFEEISLDGMKSQDLSVIIPTVSATKNSRYGTHAYYFFNAKTQKSVCVRIRHRDIILPGIQGLSEANYKKYKILPKIRLLFQKYHYGFNFPEQIMLMTVPHTITDIGDGRFIISLWSYFGYIVIDMRARTAMYCMLDRQDIANHVFGSKQWYEKRTDAVYYMTYSLKDSLKKTLDPAEKVFSRILKRNNKTGLEEEVWSGYFSDYMHDIMISKDERFLVVCEMGRFSDKNGSLIPSQALILNQETQKAWLGYMVANSAHAQFDPNDPEIIYFSNHNFQFVHAPLWKLFKKGTYAIKFLGPASVHKFRLTAEGPEEIGVFSEPDLFRLTNFQVFMHQGEKIIAATGTPNFIFIASAENMKLIKKIELKDADAPAFIGTIAASPDGDKLYIQTTRSFQILNLSDGQIDFVRSYDFNHICSNHLMVSKNTDW